MTKTFTNLNTLIQDSLIQESHRVPSKKNPNRPTARHTIVKLAKVKERTLKAARGKKKKESYTRESPQGYQLISLQKVCRSEGRALYIQNPEREKKPAT